MSSWRGLAMASVTAALVMAQVKQLETAARAAIRIDRHVRGAELIDVTIDGANRNLELARQRFGRHPAAGLQQQQDRQSRLARISTA